MDGSLALTDRARSAGAFDQHTVRQPLVLLGLMRSQSQGSMGRAATTNRLGYTPGNVDVAVTSLEKRLSELEQLADAQSRELRIPFERIAHLQAEWNIRATSFEQVLNTGGGATPIATIQVGVLVRLPRWEVVREFRRYRLGVRR